MNMLEILETNRKLKGEINLLDKNCKQALKVINENKTLSRDEKANERFAILHQYGLDLEALKKTEKHGDIIVNYNDSILYDLATMKIVPRRNIFTKENTVKDGLYVVDRIINEIDSETFADLVSQDLFYLRELAYLYFKTYRNTTSLEFATLVNNNTQNKLLSKDVVYMMYNVLFENNYINDDYISESLEKVQKATKQYLLKDKR